MTNSQGKISNCLHECLTEVRSMLWAGKANFLLLNSNGFIFLFIF
jgi:hypothetical protein